MRRWHNDGQASGTTRLASEFDRARRYEHQLALLKVAPAGHYDLADMVRSCDTTVHVNGDLYLVLPETDRAGAAELLGRLGVTASSAIADDSPAPGIAVFPDDGITPAALLAECSGAGAHPRRRLDLTRPRRQRALDG